MGFHLNKTDSKARAKGVSLREMKPTDLKFISKVYDSTRLDELANTGWKDIEISAFLDMQFEAQHRHYQDHYPDAQWLIVLYNKKRVGRLYIEEWEREFRLIDIALLPKARGQGLGGAILSDIVDHASGFGKSVGIHVEKNNPAMGLYHRLGFTKTEDKGVYDLLHWCEKNQLKTAS
ncbi:MAG: GNAT family N-acetyltransferase [Pseudomonadota bacterium]